MSNDADSHDLLSVVATVHHDRVGQSAFTVLTTCILLLCDQAQGADGFVPLNDGALCLAETLSSISAGRVREVDGRTDLDVVAASKIVELARIPLFHINQKFGCVFFLSCCAELELLSRFHVRQRDIPDFDIVLLLVSPPASTQTPPAQFFQGDSRSSIFRTT